MTDMTVTYRLEPRDMVAFQNYARKHLSTLKRVRYFNLILFAVLSLSFAAMAGDESLPVRVIMFVMMFCILWLVGWIFEFVVRKIAFWRSYTSDKHRSVLCEHTITLAEDALIEVTPFNEGRNRWSGIYQVTDAAEYIFIFISQHAAHIIPKRAFADADTARRFYEHATRLHATATGTT